MLAHYVHVFSCLTFNRPLNGNQPQMFLDVFAVVCVCAVRCSSDHSGSCQVVRCPSDPLSFHRLSGSQVDSAAAPVEAWTLSSTALKTHWSVGAGLLRGCLALQNGRTCGGSWG